MYSGYSAPLAALAGTLAIFPVAALRTSSRQTVTIRNMVDALVDGARNALPVALACACAGIIIGVVSLTGAGIVFTQVVLHLAKSTLLLALVLTMIAGIILGMGMPTTPAYIIMTALLVPVLIKLGVIEPAAHVFAFYFAILSAITPPVALATFSAAALPRPISGRAASPRCGSARRDFIVPFMFVYEPALLMIGEWPAVVSATISASAGALLLAGGLQGYLLRPAALWERALLVAAAFCLIKPGLMTDLAGIALAGAVVLSQLVAGRRDVPAMRLRKTGTS
jgi:TRAP-type uncharacterized transport system fused permease subunit